MDTVEVFFTGHMDKAVPGRAVECARSRSSVMRYRTVVCGTLRVGGSFSIPGIVSKP